MTRQGFWFVLKGYARATGDGVRITPHTRRPAPASARRFPPSRSRCPARKGADKSFIVALRGSALYTESYKT